MQAEEAVQIKHRAARNIDGRPHGVIGLLAVRHHDIQTVGRASLEDDHQPLVARARSDGRKGRAREKAGIAAVPTTARAPLRRKTRRENIRQLLASAPSY